MITMTPILINNKDNKRNKNNHKRDTDGNSSRKLKRYSMTEIK